MGFRVRVIGDVRWVGTSREILEPTRDQVEPKGEKVNGTTKPRALIVYHTYTKQTGKVADALAKQLEARGCEVTKAMIEFTDQRFVPKLFSQFPLKHPISQVSTMLTAQLRHKTGEIQIPAEAQAGDYDLVLIASPTWWIQTCMPIRSYLESPAARAILDGKPFAVVSISRRYYSVNLGQQRKLAEKDGGRFADKTHFVAAGGQVKSMMSWLGYMKHGEPQERAMGLKMPAPNLKPDFEEQARTFADGLVDRVLQPGTSGSG
jgi:menaquinone-dependent protoporphyrinogen IX oxidase